MECGILSGHFSGMGKEDSGCLLPEGHTGDHLNKITGEWRTYYIRWQSSCEFEREMREDGTTACGDPVGCDCIDCTELNCDEAHVLLENPPMEPDPRQFKFQFDHP